MTNRTYNRNRPPGNRRLEPEPKPFTKKTGARHFGAVADDQLRKAHRWTTLREWHIVRQPLCQVCGKVGDMVHHKQIPAGDPQLFYDPSNLATVCQNPCHEQIHKAYERGLKWSDLCPE